MSLLIELPDVVAANPLRIRFAHLMQVMRHHQQLNGPQGPLWQRLEYVRAVELNRDLGRYLDQYTSSDLAAMTWDDISDDVRRLTHLAENPL